MEFTKMILNFIDKKSMSNGFLKKHQETWIPCSELNHKATVIEIGKPQLIHASVQITQFMMTIFQIIMEKFLINK